MSKAIREAEKRARERMAAKVKPMPSVIIPDRRTEKLIAEVDKWADLIIDSANYVKRNVRVSAYPELVLPSKIRHLRYFVEELEKVFIKMRLV